MSDNIIDNSQKIDINSIIPTELNPNIMTNDMFSALKDNIKENGLIGSILVRKHPLQKDKYEIIDGEHRWKACKELGYKKISVIILDYNDINSAIQLIRFNREKGYFDSNKLNTLVQDLINKTNKSLVRQKLHVTNHEFDQMLNEKINETRTRVEQELDQQVDEYTNIFENNNNTINPLFTNLPVEETTQEETLQKEQNLEEKEEKINLKEMKTRHICTAPENHECKYKQ